jgi:hypothetical protein
VGSESGNECTGCGTQVILDDFSSLNPAWVAGGASCAANGISNPGGAHIVSGKMDMGGGSTIIRPFARPSLSGFCVQIKVTIASFTGFGSLGLVLAFGRLFFARAFVGDFARHSCIDGQGCVAVGSSFANFGPPLAVNDMLSMIVRDQGAGDGLCSICYQVNGTTIRVEEDISTCFPDPMYAGLMSISNNSTQFDDFEVRTN